MSDDWIMSLEAIKLVAPVELPVAERCEILRCDCAEGRVVARGLKTLVIDGQKMPDDGSIQVVPWYIFELLSRPVNEAGFSNWYQGGEHEFASWGDGIFQIAHANDPLNLDVRRELFARGKIVVESWRAVRFDRLAVEMRARLRAVTPQVVTSADHLADGCAWIKQCGFNGYKAAHKAYNLQVDGPKWDRDGFRAAWDGIHGVKRRGRPKNARKMPTGN